MYIQQKEMVGCSGTHFQRFSNQLIYFFVIFVGNWINFGAILAIFGAAEFWWPKCGLSWPPQNPGWIQMSGKRDLSQEKRVFELFFCQIWTLLPQKLTFRIYFGILSFLRFLSIGQKMTKFWNKFGTSFCIRKKQNFTK